eukprot:PhM_4_TR14672/c6_g1_i1/m.87657
MVPHARGGVRPARRLRHVAEEAALNTLRALGATHTRGNVALAGRRPTSTAQHAHGLLAVPHAVGVHVARQRSAVAHLALVAALRPQQHAVVLVLGARRRVALDAALLARQRRRVPAAHLVEVARGAARDLAAVADALVRRRHRHVPLAHLVADVARSLRRTRRARTEALLLAAHPHALRLVAARVLLGHEVAVADALVLLRRPQAPRRLQGTVRRRRVLELALLCARRRLAVPVAHVVRRARHLRRVAAARLLAHALAHLPRARLVGLARRLVGVAEAARGLALGGLAVPSAHRVRRAHTGRRQLLALLRAHVAHGVPHALGVDATRGAADVASAALGVALGGGGGGISTVAAHGVRHTQRLVGAGRRRRGLEGQEVAARALASAGLGVPHATLAGGARRAQAVRVRTLLHALVRRLQLAPAVGLARRRRQVLAARLALGVGGVPRAH